MTAPATHDPFEYLLNAMENAAQADKPAEHGYADKRRAVLEHVAALRSRAEPGETVRVPREPTLTMFKAFHAGVHAQTLEEFETWAKRYRSMLPVLPSTAPASGEDARVLDAADPYCPKCGHNRDKSSVSSIDHEDGTQSCQMCGTRWREIDAARRA